MKVVKIVGHPFSVISLYLLLMISGKAFGGFYAVFILMGLMGGVPDSILAVLGISILLVGYNIRKPSRHLLQILCCVVGHLLMVLSLISFFKTTKGYYDQTFDVTLCLVSFSLYGICVLCHVLYLLISFNGKNTEKPNRLTVAS